MKLLPVLIALCVYAVNFQKRTNIKLILISGYSEYSKAALILSAICPIANKPLEECDATGFDSSNTAWSIKKIMTH